MATETVFTSCRDALTRVQSFDPVTLGRADDLGRQMNFADAVRPAEAIIAVYKRIPLSAVSDFTDSQLNAIMAQANADYNVFKQILDFNAASPDAVGTRTNILANILIRRDQVFEQLWQYIAYGVARTTDTTLLETQSRATIQDIQDRAARLTEDLSDLARVPRTPHYAALRLPSASTGVRKPIDEWMRR